MQSRYRNLCLALLVTTALASVTGGIVLARQQSAPGIRRATARQKSVSPSAPGKTQEARHSTTPDAPLMTPANLRVLGSWQNGKEIDSLQWDPVPGAAFYTVYSTPNYTPIARKVHEAHCQVPADRWHHNVYTVTATDQEGRESIPSAPAFTHGAFDPAKPPKKESSPPKAAPQEVVAVGEWNQDGPRIRVSWTSRDLCDYYKVYRDGKLVASGLWGTNYFDGQVAPGEGHRYTVTAVNVGFPDKELESEPSAAVAAMALEHAPAAHSAPVQITDIKPNDDSVLVSFAPVPGAVDYRIYKTSDPDYVKYSGGGTRIELNDIDPRAGATLVVEAVDKLGPFQTMDGDLSPGAIQKTGMHFMAVNGQGDPSNAPNVLARSTPFPVHPRPRTLTGQQAFFDTFREEPPLTETPRGQLNPELIRKHTYGSKLCLQELQNDKWLFRAYDAVPDSTRMFVMASHFMDTIYDYNRTIRGRTVMIPKATPTLKGDQVLHVTFEVDAFSSFRRLNGLAIAPASDLVDFPDAEHPTSSGSSLFWKIQYLSHDVILNRDKQTMTLGLPARSPEQRRAQRNQPRPDNSGQTYNEGPEALDLRHRFDMYLSRSRCLLLEEGQLVRDVALNQVTAGKSSTDQTLTWLTDKPLSVIFYHSLYHSAAERIELARGYIKPVPTYWLNYRPYADERHWDNMGFEVLDRFPEVARPTIAETVPTKKPASPVVRPAGTAPRVPQTPVKSNRRTGRVLQPALRTLSGRPLPPSP